MRERRSVREWTKKLEQWERKTEYIVVEKEMIQVNLYRTVFVCKTCVTFVFHPDRVIDRSAVKARWSRGQLIVC